MFVNAKEIGALAKKKHHIAIFCHTNKLDIKPSNYITSKMKIIAKLIKIINISNKIIYLVFSSNLHLVNR